MRQPFSRYQKRIDVHDHAFLSPRHIDLLSRANARICAKLGNTLSGIGYLIADD